MPELIYCAGGNARFAKIAIGCGYTYGAQLPATVYRPVAFADQDHNNPNLKRRPYMHALKKHRPRFATVKDLCHENQYEEVVSWIIEAWWWATERIIVVPKYNGAIECLKTDERIAHVPLRYGYSVPTGYGKTDVPVEEFRGVEVHLLGGSPRKQYGLAKDSGMDVRSADGNYIQKIALWNEYLNGKTLRFQEVNQTLKPFLIDANYCAFELSCIVLKNAWKGHALNFRSAVEDDIAGIQQIAKQYKQELGFVMTVALKKGMQSKNVVVATDSDAIVGFVNYHTRKDGRQTIYEIAVHPDYQGLNIGKGLLACIPKPIQLKVTVDNERAIGFYLSQGFTEVKREQGRKRELLVLRKER